MWHIQGCIQNYDWGGLRFIPKLVGLDNLEKRSFAEIWFGVHKGCPSTTVEGSSIRDIMSASPDVFFTPAERRRWQDELPYLCKILDVEDMLSIQLHPDKKSAETGFAQEQSQRIPVHAFHRSFKDQNHKPELMYALSPFYMLHAFRPDSEIIDLMKRRKSLQPLAAVIQQYGLPHFYRNFMREDQETINKILNPLIEELQEQEIPNDPSDPNYWILRAVNKYCSDEMIDRGILSFYLLNLLKLEPGEVVYQDSGVPHAYLRGQTIEVMASSDNVIRGGLTSKYTDVSKLIELIRYDQRDAYRLEPESRSVSRLTYQPPVEEFSFSVLDVSFDTPLIINTQAISMLFSVSEYFTISSAKREIKVKSGEAVLCSADRTYTINTQSDVRLFWVSSG